MTTPEQPKPKSNRRRSTGPPHSPPPRLERPLYPPSPPLELLHPTISPTRSRHPGLSLDAIDDRGEQGGSPAGQNNDHDDDNDGERKKRPPRKGWRKLGWLGAGMRNDIVQRAPWYVSDWTDAWNYRVVPATLFVFFSNIMPGIAFSLDLIEATEAYGVQEVLLSTFIAAGFASFLGAQPLLVSGVTGPITVFNKVIYDIFKGRPDFQYLEFIGWVYVWGAILHWIAAVTNAVACLKWVTRFSCDTFGFYVAAVYVQYGIQVVTRQFHQTSTPSAFLGIVLALVTLVVPHYFNALARSGYINKGFRRFCADYGMPITIIAATGLAYWGRFNPYVNEGDMTLPVTTKSFVTATGRSWVVKWWTLEAKYVGIAFPFGVVLFILFYFDSNVSSLIAQGSEFPLKKPAGFHWDFFLLGITTLIAGFLGLPAPNGLIPQAPLHTASLVVMGYEDDSSSSSATAVGDEMTDGDGPTGPMMENAVALGEIEASQPLRQTASGQRKDKNDKKRRLSIADAKKKRKEQNKENQGRREVPKAVVEQRVSNLVQGGLCLVLMTKPFEVVLGLIPKGVLAGLFWYMGTDALLGSGVTEKMLYLVRDPRAISPTDPLNKVRRSRIIIFTFVELIGFGATFAITQTIAAIGFPVIIMLLVPVRYYIVPHLGFTEDELETLDGPVASPFTMESVSGW